MFPSIRLAKSWSDHDGERVCIGEGLFATRDFAEGQEIIKMKRPLIGALDIQRLHNTCANCYVWTEGRGGSRLYVPEDTTVQKCAGCQRMRYCGKQCQREAWTRGHKHECKILSTIPGEGMPKAVAACMELLIRRKNGLITDEIWNSVLKLDPHIDDFKKSGLYENIELMAMGASQFSSTGKMFDKDFVIAMYARVLANSLTLITPTLDPLGIILDPTLGKLNHSCDPNAFVIMDGAQTSLRTLKPIKKDEEIYISYIDNTNPYMRRQKELKARWFLECRCTKCEELTLLEEDKFLDTPENMSAEICKEADTILAKPGYRPDAANYVGDSAAAKRVAAIQSEAFEKLTEAQSAGSTEEAINSIKEGMRLCRESKIWPLHRQPYAALRDEYIVQLLSEEKFGLAWDQCAKRLKYIDSKLYPLHHPVRVVHMWQTTTLALWVAGMSEGMKGPSEDMQFIAIMQGAETLKAAEMSHGSDNSFTQSVLQMMHEGNSELERIHGRMDSPGMIKKLMSASNMLAEMGDRADI